MLAGEGAVAALAGVEVPGPAVDLEPGPGAVAGQALDPALARGHPSDPGSNASMGPGPNASVGPGASASTGMGQNAQTGPGGTVGHGTGHGPADGTGNQGVGPQDGTGFGAPK